MTERIDLPHPDNRFFFDEAQSRHQGESIRGQHEGVSVTLGYINPGTHEVYSVETPEIVVVLEGTVSIGIEDEPESEFVSGDVFVLPNDKSISLATGSEQPFTYVCFYPQNREDLAKIRPFIQEELRGTVTNFADFYENLGDLSPLPALTAAHRLNILRDDCDPLKESEI